MKTYRTVTLSAVLCGCETWSVTMKEQYRVGVFENRVVRTIFGLKRGGRKSRLEKTV